MHSGPRWNRGSAKRIAQTRLRGNWPNRSTLVAIALALLASWALLYAYLQIEVNDLS